MSKRRAIALAGSALALALLAGALVSIRILQEDRAFRRAAPWLWARLQPTEEPVAVPPPEAEIRTLRGYLAQYPRGRHAEMARRGIEEVEASVDDGEWGVANETGTRKAYEACLKRFPNGRHAGPARRTLASLLDPGPLPEAVSKAIDQGLKGCIERMARMGARLLGAGRQSMGTLVLRFGIGGKGDRLQVVAPAQLDYVVTSAGSVSSILDYDSMRLQAETPVPAGRSIIPRGALLVRREGRWCLDHTDE